MIRWQDYIKRDPARCFGKPVFKGTRLTVEWLLEKIGHGMSPDELLRGYPTMKPEFIQAAMLYASEVVGVEWLVGAE